MIYLTERTILHPLHTRKRVTHLCPFRKEHFFFPHMQRQTSSLRNQRCYNPDCEHCLVLLKKLISDKEETYVHIWHFKITAIQYYNYYSYITTSKVMICFSWVIGNPSIIAFFFDIIESNPKSVWPVREYKLCNLVILLLACNFHERSPFFFTNLFAFFPCASSCLCADTVIIKIKYFVVTHVSFDPFI